MIPNKKKKKKNKHSKISLLLFINKNILLVLKLNTKFPSCTLETQPKFTQLTVC